MPEIREKPSCGSSSKPYRPLPEDFLPESCALKGKHRRKHSANSDYFYVVFQYLRQQQYVIHLNGIVAHQEIDDFFHII
jgi:hypothetical protein